MVLAVAGANLSFSTCRFGYVILFVFLLNILFFQDLVAAECDPWELPPSRLMKKEVRQQESGMCYAHSASKAMEFFNKSIGVKNSEPSVLELATKYHHKLLFLRQLFSKLEYVKYSKGESVLDWGDSCDSINYILENGTCDKKIYSSSSLHLLYNMIRNLNGVNLKFCNDCENELIGFSNENKRIFSETFIKMAKDEIEQDSALSIDEKNELIKLAEKLFSNKRKVNWPREVKLLERKVRRHCKKSKPDSKYNGYKCNSYVTGAIVKDPERHNELTNELILKTLAKRNGQALMIGMCANKLNSSIDMELLNGYEVIGYAENCYSQHAVTITGARPKGERCEVLIEDNYPGVCNQKNMPWVTCELNKAGDPTGRYWMDTKRLAPVLINIALIEKN